MDRREFLVATAVAGAALYRPGSDQSIGNVVNCAADGDDFRMLAVVTTASIPEGVHLESPDGPQLRFQELPYPLPTD